MLELSKEERALLEKTVFDKLCANLPEGDAGARLYSVITTTAISATIETIIQYERMKNSG